MSSDFINLLIQIPLVGIFIYYVLTSNKQHAISAKDNHAEWRDWLREERVARQEFAERQNHLITASIERMNERIASLESRRVEERAEMMIVLRELQESIEHLSTAMDRVIVGKP